MRINQSPLHSKKLVYSKILAAMKNKTQPPHPCPHLNLRPALLAASLAEAGRHAPEQIAIRPAPGQQPELIREVVELKEREGQELEIRVKSKSEERLELEQALAPGSSLQALASVFEKEFGLFCIEQAREEREQALGTSELFTRFFTLPAFLDEEQQRILAYYLPFLPQIRGDLMLTERCIHTATGKPARLSLEKSRAIHIRGAEVGGWVVNGGPLIGGRGRSRKPCLRISIGPVLPEEMEGLVPGCGQRRFLEEALLPAILPREWDWELEVVVEERRRRFEVPGAEVAVRVGMNSFVE